MPHPLQPSLAQAGVEVCQRDKADLEVQHAARAGQLHQRLQQALVQAQLLGQRRVGHAAGWVRGGGQMGCTTPDAQQLGGRAAGRRAGRLTGFSAKGAVGLWLLPGNQILIHS